MPKNDRAGKSVMQSTGYRSFVPTPLPPNPKLVIDEEMQKLLSLADRKLGRLDGIATIIPNPDLFVLMYVRKEALLSSQIEGTQASLIDVVEVDNNDTKPESIREVINYVNAINIGLNRLNELPLSLRLIREIHTELLSGTRGGYLSPGEFRSTQNWVGAPGSTLSTAVFVPPNVHDMNTALGDLEKYMHAEDALPDLIRIALIHAQFETIHPFLDGNGRIGRLLITFWLCERKILSMPLLYLSYYFKKNKHDYYDYLTAIREEGKWEEWVKFFLSGVIEVAEESVQTAKEIISLEQECKKRINSQVHSSQANCLKLLEYLFVASSISAEQAAKYLNVSPPTARKCLAHLTDLGIVVKASGKARYIKYTFALYLQIMVRGTE